MKTSKNILKSIKYTVDSFKIRIPYEFITIVNPSLEGQWIAVNTETSEIDPFVFRKNSYHVNDKGIKVKYAIQEMRLGKGGVEKFLVILINSKTLKEKYLQGITKENIKEVYNYLISQEIAKFSFDDFMKSEVTDVDFKRDIVRSDTEMVINSFYSVTNEILKQLTKKHLTKDNKGIEWSKRSETDSSKPFFKIYHKGLELKKHSVEFYENYILDSEPDDLDYLLRIEFTIKNKAHFKRFEITDTTLKSILEISQDKRAEMLQSIAKKYLDIYEIKPVKIKTKLNPNDRIILTAMNLIVDAKIYSMEPMIKVFVDQIENRSQKSQKKKELTILYETHLKPYMLEAERMAKLNENVRDILFG